MGGTSFDITLTKDGITNLNKNIDFLRYRIGVPMIQVETLGAGGGSIGWIDSLGILQVGPQSAGSQPGPACYGQGGEEPTTSDANLVLGYLNPDGLLGGKLPLSVEKARAAMRKVAEPLGLTIEQAAYGMYTIVNNNMVNGIRRVSVERGFDPRDFVLVGAGGATAAHIIALAREIGIETIILPKLASGLCAANTRWIPAARAFTPRRLTVFVTATLYSSTIIHSANSADSQGRPPGPGWAGGGAGQPRTRSQRRIAGRYSLHRLPGRAASRAAASILAPLW